LYRIVLDTNVVIAALMSKRGASNKLFRLIGTGKFDLVLSVALTLEYESVAKRHAGGRILYTFDEIDEILDFLRDSANQRGIYFLWRMAIKDPDDGLVLDLAANADCQYIVTFNIRDFPDIEQFSLKAVTPKQFLEILENEA
jgi:putative PIN family toxin of toxin-antitoxin system